MPRYKLTIEYAGEGLVGWQRQREGASVQGAIEDAFAAIGEAEVGLVGAGRTDAGVHALAQVAHADTIRDWDPFRLSEALNHHLRPARIAILRAELPDPEFHARFDAVERLYRYRIALRRAPLTLERDRAWRIVRPLDHEAMRAAARHLVGRHDFTTFRSIHCQAQSPVKTLDEIRIDQTKEGLQLVFRARSFLHNQVRSLVGTLERAGAGRMSPDDVRAALEARDRAACGPVAPPEGLYLAGVRYPGDPPFAV